VRSDPLRAALRRKDDPSPVVEQVFNADRPTANLTPVSEAPAQAVRDGWAALLSGEQVAP
jgi:hypothetical protein